VCLFVLLVDHDWQFAIVFIACELDQFIQLGKCRRNNLCLFCKFDLFVRAMAHTGLRITLQLRSDTQVLPVGVQRGSLCSRLLSRAWQKRSKQRRIRKSPGQTLFCIHPLALGALRTIIAVRPLYRPANKEWQWLLIFWQHRFQTIELTRPPNKANKSRLLRDGFSPAARIPIMSVHVTSSAGRNYMCALEE